jgi:predicted metalloendopeptidase
VPSAQLPKSALDILDEAAAMQRIGPVALADAPPLAITEAHVAEAVASATGIPVARVQQTEADKLLAFETEIAKISWPQADLRDLDKLNNPMTPGQLLAYAPGLDWNVYLSDAGINSPKLIVGDNTAVKAVAALYDKTPLETLKIWQRFKVADQASNYLSKRFVDSKFEFGRTLTGAKELRPRWRRGIGEVDGRLGELLGETYVQRYFTPQSKAAMEELVANLGIGLPYFVAKGLGTGVGRAVAATFEYGNTFAIVSGLLNMLAVLDAYDIAEGRK